MASLRSSLAILNDTTRVVAAPMTAPPARTNQPRPTSLVKATLRPYQQHGVGWLGWIGDAGPGGVLADDMGLGKTVQVLEALARIHQKRGTLRVLIVTTKSTTHNWRSECARFAPWLTVAVWAGPERHRHRTAIFSRYHIVITSYAHAQRDLATLRQVVFDWVILDEAQAIKNTDSVTHKAVSALRGDRRLAMTGTPMENSPEDFHAIFDWAVPGIVGSKETFAATYGEALAKGDTEAARRLQHVVGPYLLRRKKEEVATDLPGKTETLRYIDLPPVQRRVYDLVHQAAYQALASPDAQHATGIVSSRKRMAVFAALTKLRQVACDPRLLGIPYASGGKLRELVTIVLDAKAKGEKVLVFSSFKSMILLLEKDLAKFGIVTVTITGDTDDREGAVKRFQTDPKAQVFLITLKAGGSGLNLTAATRVVHFDPWWNPAAQDQASDRAYRIGQTKPVSVVSLLAADTVEEKVIQAIGKKRDVANLLLGEGQDQPLFAHTMADLLDLLGPPRR